MADQGMGLQKVYILSGFRTPIGALNGVLSSLPAHKLGAMVIKAAIDATDVKPKDISEVIMGQVLTAGQGQNPARQAALAAGLPTSVPAYGVNMLCGSGLKAVCLGYQSIMCGDSEAIVCGGQESMSQAQHSAHMRQPCRLGTKNFEDTITIDGLTDAMLNISMGLTAENLAEKFIINREQQDEYAHSSISKVHSAQKAGLFTKEIVEVNIPPVRGQPVKKISIDECKKAYTVEELTAMRPAFYKDGRGTVTAGNASSINDGAAVVLLVNEKVLKTQSKPPLAQIIGWAEAGIDPIDMGLGPVKAVQKLMQKLNWFDENVDLYELNEAFSVQSLAVLKELGCNKMKINVGGGAVALGHPIGASGARILVTLLYHMQRLSKRNGIAALCIGGGMGIAIAVQNNNL